MYGKLFESDDYISDVVRRCRGFREFVRNEILKGVGGHSSASGTDENNEPIQYIGEKKVLIKGSVLEFIDKVYWLTYHIERFVTWNTPANPRYKSLKVAIDNIPGGKFNSKECFRLADEAVSFFVKYDEAYKDSDNAAIAILKAKTRQQLTALSNVFVDRRKSRSVTDKLEQLDSVIGSRYNDYNDARDLISEYCCFLYEYINEVYDDDFTNLLDFHVGDVAYWPTGVDYRTDDNFYYKDESEDNTKRFAPPTVNIKQIDTFSIHKVLMILNDISYNSFEEFIGAMADTMSDCLGKVDASQITDALHDYRVQVMKKFPNVEFDVSSDEFERVIMTLQRVINNLYNPMLVSIIDKESW
jgi:hypothetical protein